MAGKRKWTVEILGDAGSLAKAAKEAEGATMSLEERAGKLGEAVTLGYGIGQVVQFGKASVTAAMDDAKAQEELARQLKTSTGATSDQIAEVENWIGKTQDATGVLDDQLRPALATLVRSTKDATEAERLLQLSMDVSKGTGKDLETVSLALVKAHDGNVGALGRLGVATKDAEGKTMTFNQVVDGLNKTFGGATAAAAETAAGKYEIFQAKMSSLQENVGNALLPVMSQLTAVIGDIAGWFNSLSPEVQGAVTKLVMFGGGALLAMKAIGSAKEAISGFTAATKLSSAALGGALGVAAAAGAIYIALASDKARLRKITDGYAEALKAEQAGQDDASDAAIAKSLADKDLIDKAKAIGLSVADLTRVIRGGQVPAYDAAGEAARKWAKNSSTGNAELDRQGRYAKDVTQAIDVYRNAMSGAIETNALQAKTAREVAAAVDVMSIAHKTLDPMLRISAAGAKEHAKELAAERQAAKDATKAFQDQEAALRSLWEATRSSIDAEYGYQKAAEDTTSALGDLLQAHKDATDGTLKGDEATKQIKQSSDDLRQSVLDEADAWLRSKEEAAKAHGLTIDAATAAGIYKDKLKELADKVRGDAPEVAAAIDTIVTKMDEAFKARNWTVTVTGKIVAGDSGSGSARVWKRSALGNMLTAGDWSWVGESGPELIHVGAPAKVYSNQQSKRLVSSGPGRGGVTLNVYPARLNVDRHDLEQLVARAEALYAR